MPRTPYLLHGLRISSSIPLAAPIDDDDTHGGGVPDAVLEWGDPYAVPDATPPGKVVAAVTRRDDPRRPFYTAVAAEDGYVLRLHGTCDVRVSAGLDQVVCHRDPAADPELVAVYLSGLAVAFLLGLRRDPILHASAVSVPELDGRVAAIAGAAGVGKSTVTALLCAAGCAFVGDDLLRLSFADGVISAVGGCSELRLRPATAHVLDAFGALQPKTRETADGRIALGLGARDGATRRIAAIVLPWPDRSSNEVCLERPHGGDAIMQLTRSPRFEGWTSPAVTRIQFEAVARAVASVPVVLAHIPWSPRPDVAGAKALVAELIATTGRT